MLGLDWVSLIGYQLVSSFKLNQNQSRMFGTDMTDCISDISKEKTESTEKWLGKWLGK